MMYILGSIILFLAIFAFNRLTSKDYMKIGIGYALVLSLASWIGIFLGAFALAVFGFEVLVKRTDDWGVNKFFKGEENEV